MSGPVITPFGPIRNPRGNVIPLHRGISAQQRQDSRDYERLCNEHEGRPYIAPVDIARATGDDVGPYEPAEAWSWPSATMGAIVGFVVGLLAVLVPAVVLAWVLS